MAAVDGRFCATAVVVSIVAAIMTATALTHALLPRQWPWTGPETHTEPEGRAFRTRVAGSSIGDLMDGPLHGVLLEHVHFTSKANNKGRGFTRIFEMGWGGLVPAENIEEGPVAGARVPHRARENREDAGHR